MAESQTFIQLPADSTGKRIRVYKVDQQQTDGSIYDVYEQVMILADPNGNLVYVKGQALRTVDDRVADLLSQVIVGQAVLCKLLIAAIRPGVERIDDVNDFIQFVEGQDAS
jgi:hypothetical protein